MGNCLINLCCCEHNCIIFPAPRAKHGWEFQSFTTEVGMIGNGEVKVQLNKFQNEDGQTVPYMQISSQVSRKKEQIIIYFHGNAEDIFHSVDFVLPIFQSTEITILCLEYPTYSCYTTDKKYFISDRIKSNSIQFHRHIQTKYNKKTENIFIMGRSIGTGPAAYLASNVKCQKLVLISPFDSIRKVSMGLLGCTGFMVKNHFSNEESILKHEGDLLVIHGRADEVINFKHGKALVEVYENGMNHKKCTFVQPVRMSHNMFDMAVDIVKPIKQFLNSN